MSPAVCVNGGALSERQLFHRALNSDEFPECLPMLRQWVNGRLGAFSSANASTEAGDFQRLEDELRVLRASRFDLAKSLEEVVGECSDETCRLVLRQYAPTGLLAGCILQYAVGIAINHTDFGSIALRLYSHEVGDGYPARHQGAHYRDLLRSMRITVPEVAASSFVDETSVAGADRAIDDWAFELALFGVALSHFPRTLLPEIVGAALFYYVGGLPPALRALRERLRKLDANVRFLDEHALTPEFGIQATQALEAARALLSGSVEIDRKPDHSCLARMWAGMRSAAAIESRWQNEILAIVRRGGLTPRARMERLVRERAPQIIGYHRRSVRLEALMKDAVEHPDKLLDWLAKSRFVIPGNAQGSPFVTELTAFEGPMFRVFSPEEMAVITAWIDHLPQQAAESPASTAEHRTADAAALGHVWNAPVATATDHVDADVKPKSLRELYHRLTNFEPSPADRRLARRAVEINLEAGRVIARGRCAESEALNLGETSLPLETYKLAPYSAEYLAEIVNLQHRLQLERYRRHCDSRVEPPSRESLLTFMVTLSGSLLADGSWLQNVILAATSHSEVHGRLFRIYSDELGNGDPIENHCNVCRRALEAAGIFLPDMRDPSFGFSPPIPDSAFAHAVYTLGISLFPKRFFPELLGMNLAIELYGVGGETWILDRNFRARGLDPRFWTLHNTIDNVGTGHASWSREAIQLYMDDIFALGGDELGRITWERVWTGFCSWSARSYVPRVLGDALCTREDAGPGSAVSIALSA